jgi:hypothetical protein
MQRANLISGRVPEISKVQSTEWPFPWAWWLFAGSSTIGNASCMKSLYLLGCLSQKSNRPAIGMGCSLAIKRLSD